MIKRLATEGILHTYYYSYVVPETWYPCAWCDGSRPVTSSPEAHAVTQSRVTVYRETSKMGVLMKFEVATWKLRSLGAGRVVHGQLRRGGDSVSFDLEPGLYRLRVASYNGMGWDADKRITLVSGQHLTLTVFPVSRMDSIKDGSYERIRLREDAPPGDAVQPELLESVRPLPVTPSPVVVPTVVRRATASTSKPTPEPEVLELIEKNTTYEDIGTEMRTIDNPSRGSTATRSFKATREWSRTCELGKSVSKAGGVKAKFGPSWVGVEGNIQAELQRSYSISGSERQEYSEEVSIQVAPGAKVQLTLHWKRVWLNGVVRVRNGNSIVDVPYRIARGLTFDQSVTDV